MTSAAYEINTASLHRKTRPAPQLRVVRGGRYGVAKAKLFARRLGLALAAALMLGLMVSVVASQAQLTALSGEIASVRSELTAAQSTYDYLSSSMDNITNSASVQQIAEGRLGLVKADSSQITYVRLEDESVIRKNASNAAKLLDGIRTAALSLIGSLDP